MTVRAALCWLGGVLIGLAIAGLALGVLLRESDPEGQGFVSRVDLSPLDRAALQHRGRFKSFDSFAHEVMRSVSGRGGIVEPTTGAALPADQAYLDLMIRSEAYARESVVHVRKKPMRAVLARALEDGGLIDSEASAAMVEDGMVSVALLESPEALGVRERWSRDLVRTAKFENEIANAIALTESRTLARLMRVIPPGTGNEKTPWVSVWELFDPPSGQGMSEGHALAEGLPAEVRDGLRAHWGGFIRAWRAREAEEASASLASFCALLPSVDPDLYPDLRRLGYESLYVQSKFLVWDWLIYLVSVVLLLMGVAFRWPAARWTGMGVFSVALAVQTLSIGMRWYVSGRWPNSNMFEAVTTSVWFGALVAVVLEGVARKTPLRNLFAIGAGVASMAAMMSGQFVDRLDPSINNMMPILHDLWLYIHTNTIIASYALIAMASVTAGLYLVGRVLGGGAEYARVGGTGMLLGTEGRRGTTMGEVLDGATLVLMELSFVMLWAGIVMGAIWADHSWGRPWGWDPKEVFALNTFLVFLVLIHVRLRVRDKGLWTAVLAVVGCGVMLFNWIVINFVISGLHSYA